MIDSHDSLVHAFLDWAEQTPDAPFLRFDGATWSYAQMRVAVLSAAAHLQAHEVQRGDRVGLFLDNSAQFIACYFGIHILGGVVVLINTQYRQQELRHILSDSQASLVITDDAGLTALESVRHELLNLDIIEIGDWRLEISQSPISNLQSPISDPSTTLRTSLQSPISNLPHADELAILAYTSGTTGRSKGAMLTHGNLASNSRAVTNAWHWTSADRLLLTLPLFHIHGLGVGVNGTLLTGASIDLRRRFDATEVLDTLRSGEVTMFFGVPTMYTRLIDEVRRQKATESTEIQEQLPSLQPSVNSVNSVARMRLFVSGSAPLSPQTFAEFEELFGQRILERYGMSETVMNLTNPYEGERRPGTVGMPFPGQEARIVDVRSRQPAPDETVGEIQVRGPHVFKGYWQRPDATAEAFDSEGWFNTGDLGRRSADGYFTITGRAKELIISGGYNIYPREVEEALLACPGVAEAAVFGMPDAEMGEHVVAAIVPTSSEQPPSEELIIAFCRTQLAAYKKPRRIIFLDSLPRNALGKVQKHILREGGVKG
jgi:malonyl-CoA/methylmalonyl-CoA synthetase